jgi:hypothetical protein
LNSKQFVDASRAFASIVRDFQGLHDLAAVTSKAEQLGKSDEVKKKPVAKKSCIADNFAKLARFGCFG